MIKANHTQIKKNLNIIKNIMKNLLKMKIRFKISFREDIYLKEF